MEAATLDSCSRWLEANTPLTDRQYVAPIAFALLGGNLLGLLQVEGTRENQLEFWKFIAFLGVPSALVLIKPNRHTRAPMLLVLFSQGWGWVLMGFLLGFFRRPSLVWVSILAATPAPVLILFCFISRKHGMIGPDNPPSFFVPNLILHGIFWGLCMPYVTMLTRGWWFPAHEAEEKS